MQSLIALYTIEVEYIALSTSLREVIATIYVLQELDTNGALSYKGLPTILCKTFEDNMSCLKIDTDHMTRPRTKHIPLRLHHFRSHVVNKTIQIEYISTKNQITDMLSKPLPKPQFELLRNMLMKWESYL